MGFAGPRVCEMGERVIGGPRSGRCQPRSRTAGPRPRPASPPRAAGPAARDKRHRVRGRMRASGRRITDNRGDHQQPGEHHHPEHAKRHDRAENAPDPPQAVPPGPGLTPPHCGGNHPLQSAGLLPAPHQVPARQTAARSPYPPWMIRALSCPSPHRPRVAAGHRNRYSGRADHSPSCAPAFTPAAHRWLPGHRQLRDRT